MKKQKSRESRMGPGVGRGGEGGRGSNQSINSSVFPEYLSTLRFLFTE